jgi:hypothetical protein
MEVNINNLTRLQGTALYRSGDKSMIHRMLATVVLSSLFALCALFSISAAVDDLEKLLGNWKLVSVYAEDVQTKQKYNPYGDHPKGYIAFTSAGVSLPSLPPMDPGSRRSWKSRPHGCIH